MTDKFIPMEKMRIVNGEEALSYEDYIEIDELKELISKLKDNIVENDIYTVDEIFRLINEVFVFSELSEVEKE